MQKQEWIALFTTNKDKLRQLVEKFHPASLISVVLAGEDVDVLAAATHSKDQYPITAPGPEAACAKIREEIREENPLSPVLRFDVAAGDMATDELVQLLNDTWFGMPESEAVRGEPGFHELCDLCEGVDEEEGEEEDEYAAALNSGALETIEENVTEFKRLDALKSSGLLLALVLLVGACGETFDSVTQATWWKTKEAMCSTEMREWSRQADRRNRIVDRIGKECYAQDNAACTELRNERTETPAASP
jgi:hypothetical protein